MKSVPVTVLTGFLGAGKTTIILSLIDRLPKEYNVVLLKNEFGDVQVDSELARSTKSHAIEVKEIMNGCMCCVLVGQMKLALLELKEKFSPDRIIIETSGSAFPAPIAWQIRELAGDGFVLDGIITVIDCVNFTGYEDTSYTARMQAQYTDVILMNKHELVSERQYDLVLDNVNELNTDTPKLKCEGTHGVSPDLVFGIDTKLFQLGNAQEREKWNGLMDPEHHSNEIDLIQVTDPDIQPEAGACGSECAGGHHHHHHHHEHSHGHDHDSHAPAEAEAEAEAAAAAAAVSRKPIDLGEFERFLAALPKDDVYRVKGMLRINGKIQILNWAFGRHTLTEAPHQEAFEGVNIKITVMGNGLGMLVKRIQEGFGVDHVKLIRSGRH
ncbi:CobW/HypB/UreG, nucleotide-binding domain-containing protein [Polychytrium aggregatum]|uniref:CobW/HypB/UreG, nucleotide-binding domain-containing protein n=1 Tax=Polychytrium aggregatum TaxID=110093 RepID=UPI0022FEC965|nr:CobW/HypB/UreG, nucleotide-binding domain-containing protein [Polychytrium aggregatum]KAI9205606.1 CobW/HypB/UreG, nucleotide-binding domain-containing protein [Polychytrium aggregatum]